MQYTKLFPTLFNGETADIIRDHDNAPQAFALAAYLISRPEAELFGIFRFTPNLDRHHLGMGLEDTLTAIHTLEEAGFIRYYEPDKIVHILHFTAHQIGPLKPGDKRLAWIKKQTKNLPKHTSFEQWFKTNQQEYGLQSPTNWEAPIPHQRPIEAPKKPLHQDPSIPQPSPIEAPSKPHEFHNENDVITIDKPTEVPESEGASKGLSRTLHLHKNKKEKEKNPEHPNETTEELSQNDQNEQSEGSSFFSNSESLCDRILDASQNLATWIGTFQTEDQTHAEILQGIEFVKTMTGMTDDQLWEKANEVGAMDPSDPDAAAGWQTWLILKAAM